MRIKKCLIGLSLSCIIGLTACGHSSASNLNVSPESVESSYVGEYKLYETSSKLEYLAFLRNLDTKKYELINIDTGYYAYAYTMGEYYMVTYKQISE